MGLFGSALSYLAFGLAGSLTVLFLAQIFGVELSLWQQTIVLLICILGGIGTILGPLIGAVARFAFSPDDAGRTGRLP